MKQVEFIGNQGDCHFYRLDEFPEGERQIDQQCKKLVLAYGEVTGHNHAVVDGSVELFRVLNKAYEGLLFLHAKTDVKIDHGLDKDFKGKEPDQDYHHSAKLPAGKYLVGIVQETDHIAKVTRRVID